MDRRDRADGDRREILESGLSFRKELLIEDVSPLRDMCEGNFQVYRGEDTSYTESFRLPITQMQLQPITASQLIFRAKNPNSLSSSLIYPLTARVVGAPQMISRPVSSIFPVLHCPQGLGELQACPFPNVVFPPIPLSALSSSPFHCALRNGFGQTL